MNRVNHIERDLKGTYLWVNCEGIHGEKYEELMLEKQQILRLIRFYETENVGEEWYVYQIESRKSFLEVLGNGRLSCLQMEGFIQSLIQVMDVIDGYLLEPSNLILEMPYIYEMGERWDYIYVPGYKVDFWKQMEKLSEEWLNYVDYADEKAVLWAYTFYEKVHAQGCSLSMLEDILRLEKKSMPLSENVLHEEVAVYQEAQKTPVLKKKHWWTPLKVMADEKLKRPRRKEEQEVSEFFSKKNHLEDTCPSLEVPVFSEDEDIKQLTLIPVGENEASVIRFKTFPVLLGRAKSEVEIWMEYPGISRIHARFEQIQNKVKVVDMNSANGTYRNGERLKPGDAYDLYVGDILKLADLEFICQWC